MLTSRQVEDLLKASRQATKSAYAPYSGFRVGAAVLTEDGKIFSGCNVENASYSLTICAERAAVFKAVSEGTERIIAAAVTVDPETSRSPFPPCGACRQVLAEFMEPEGVIIVDRMGQYKLSELLPISFESKLARGTKQ